MTEEDFLQKLWKVTNELASQHQTNQDFAGSLSSQLQDLKQRAVSTSNNGQEQAESTTTVPIDRIHSPLPSHVANDLSTSERQPKDLISDNYKLMQKYQAVLNRNQYLESECSNLQSLVKDYETNIEAVTIKLRSHANATTEGQSKLRREYEALLDAEKGTTAALFIENTTLQSRLHKLASMLRSLHDDGVNDEREALITQLTAENQGLRDMLHLPLIPQAEIPDQTSQLMKDMGTKEERVRVVSESGISGPSNVVEEYFVNDDE
ncbi:hypothetical protein J3Q64DRAFT_1828692 [Phycomyces blakesleeanus]|uniref:Uncharacterized protein n=2 Tax=Phycomyces blakesleeanus TaxID=4837 RepID=A0A167Q6Y1_PHYB8|nr:hypothetical protein PHYBLDRAFT_179005 [Phycomyces blakesleeanus NRRL 1555(-)]OAD79178.1 hypothetical protein PHYBLDRAFT_179005 [Phycomyces blakesleeanus NRRL 1555(-)]|eukprot:XP_018297218.1 hypothetical protein PHYBLDRAFT_179005 [Phycomyces blakesleeanus NRRL 1555(-)]